jgi:hypothetical protein
MTERPWWKQTWKRRLGTYLFFVGFSVFLVLVAGTFLLLLLSAVAEGHRQLHEAERNPCECTEVTP